MNEYFEWFVSQGFSFFPLARGSKKPAVKWEEFQSRRPTEEEINEWRSAGYDNFAIVEGPVSGGLYILDFESEEDAKELFGEEYQKILENTLVVETPHGGIHIYFRSGAQLKRQIRIFGDAHPVDLLGEGGYAVAPGSVIDCPEGDCNEGTRGVYKVRTTLKLLTITDPVSMLEFLASKAGWELKLEGAGEKQGKEAPAEKFVDLTPDQIAQIAEILAKYWEKGRRNALTIRLCGAFIHNAISAESAKEVIRRTCEIKQDTECAEFIRLVDYEYKPKVLLKKKLLGIPSLMKMFREISPDGEKDASRIAEIIAPPEGEQAFLPKRIALFLIHNYELVTVGGETYIRDEKKNIYVRLSDAQIHKLIFTTFPDENISTRTLNDAMNYIKALTLQSHDFFNTPPYLLPVENGVVDLRTGEMREYDKNDRFIFQLPVKFDPFAKDCPNFKKLISEIVYPEDVPLLQEWFGYNLYRAYPAQKAMLFVGSGSNGKTTLIKILVALLGRENVTAVSLHDLETNRFAPADLFGKLANIVNELPSSALRETKTFKAVTGGDLLRAEKKYREAFTFENYAKLTFATNQLPKVGDDTDAFFRRWLIVSFPFKFSLNPKPGEKLADPTLAEKIIQHELPCVLNWAIEGLQRLMRNGWNFSYGKTIEETRRDYIRKSDPVRAFMQDALELKPDAWVPKPDLYKAYVEYCIENKLPAVTEISFFMALAKYGIDTSKTERKEINGKRVRVLLGVALKPKELWGKSVEEIEAEEEKSAELPVSEGATAEQPSAQKPPAEGEQHVEVSAEQRSAECEGEFPADIKANIKPGAGGCYCALCGYGPLDASNALLHFKEKHPYVLAGAEKAQEQAKETAKEQKAEEKKKEKKTQSPEGALPAEVMSKLKKEGDEWRCAICDAGPWSDPKMILRHFSAIHPEVLKTKSAKESQILKCPVCGARFFSEKDLEEHMELHKGAVQGEEGEETEEGEEEEEENEEDFEF